MQFRRLVSPSPRPNRSHLVLNQHHRDGTTLVLDLKSKEWRATSGQLETILKADILSFQTPLDHVVGTNFSGERVRSSFASGE